MLDRSAYISPRPPSGKREMAEHALRSAIVHCTLPPGARLSEAQLAAEFGLGRGAVRAALARLQTGGFVAASPRSGWAVAPVSAAEIREVCIARRQLEPLLPAAPLGPEDAARLAGLGEVHRALATRDDLGRELTRTLRRAEREILDLLAARLGTPVIARWLADVWDRAARLVQFFEARRPVGLPAPDRSGLVDAVLGGRRDEARAALAAANGALEAWLLERFMDAGPTLAAPAIRRGDAAGGRAGRMTDREVGTEGVRGDAKLS